MLLALVKRRGKKKKEDERELVRLEMIAVCIQVLGIFENPSIDFYSLVEFRMLFNIGTPLIYRVIKSI